MRCPVLLLAVISLVVTKASAEVVADISAPVSVKKEKKQADQEEDGKSTESGVPERDLAAAAAPTTTKKPLDWKKLVGPVAGGVVGAGALAGVIAVSVMRNTHQTTPKPAQLAPKAKASNEALAAQIGPFVSKESALTAPVQAGAQMVSVVNQAGFHVGDNVIFEQGTKNEESNSITSFGSIILKDPLKFPHPAGAPMVNVAPALGQIATPAPAQGDSSQGDSFQNLSTGTNLLIIGVVGGLCACCLVVLVCALFLNSKKKKTKKPSKEVYSPMQRDEEQPLTRMPPPPPAMMNPSYQSQYLPVGGMESQYMPVAPSGFGSIQQPSGFGSMPTLDVVPMQTMPPMMLNQPVTTAYAAASPLAQTQNAVLAAGMPTMNNMARY